MEPYFFQGVVLPERAQLTAQFGVGFVHLGSGFKGQARVSVINNQIAIWVDTEHEWNIFDLRNVVRNILTNDLAMIGFLNGYVYDVELTRVVNHTRKIDYVFGIDIPCIAERRQNDNLHASLLELRNKAVGPHGIFLHRCFKDLVSSMKDADDTGFYCYRAIESLRHHCAERAGLTGADKFTQWAKFREISGASEDDLRVIKAAADPLRHGQPESTSAVDREQLLVRTWKVVEAYLIRIS